MCHTTDARSREKQSSHMDYVGFLQWPAMVVTIAAAWLVASSHRGRRNAGFWLFLASNVLWVALALHVHAPALIALHVGLATMNIRGALKTEKAQRPSVGAESAACSGVGT